jgi:hypothetical protein
LATGTLEIVGSSNGEVKEFGPVHEYVAPTTVFEVRFNVLPSHNGVLAAAEGAAGLGVIETVMVD